MIACPFLTNNVCSIAAAYYAEQRDFVKAKLFTDLLYFFWTFYCFVLAVWILFAGLKLLSIIGGHLHNQYESAGNPATINRIKNGAFKVKMIMLISVTSLVIFSFIKCAYGVSRMSLLLDRGLNLAIATVWTFDGTIASMLVVMTVLIRQVLVGDALTRLYNNNSSFIALKHLLPFIYQVPMDLKHITPQHIIIRLIINHLIRNHLILYRV
jgi:hypothetical protein